MINEQTSSTQWSAFPEAVGRVDLLLGHAAMMAADWWGDAVADDIFEAMGIALLMAAQYPASTSIWVPGVPQMTVEECIDAAFAEVEEWDLGWAFDLPDLARLRVLLYDARRDLTARRARQG